MCTTVRTMIKKRKRKKRKAQFARESIHPLTSAAADAMSAGAPPLSTQGDPSKACAGTRSSGVFRRHSATNTHSSREKRQGSSLGAGASTMVWTRSIAVASSWKNSKKVKITRKRKRNRFLWAGGREGEREGGREGGRWGTRGGRARGRTHLLLAFII